MQFELPGFKVQWRYQYSLQWWIPNRCKLLCNWSPLLQTHRCTVFLLHGSALQAFDYATTTPVSSDSDAPYTPDLLKCEECSRGASTACGASCPTPLVRRAEPCVMIFCERRADLSLNLNYKTHRCRSLLSELNPPNIQGRLQGGAKQRSCRYGETI